eukprot:176758-Pyramimonas_sp.AAC.1
MWVALQTSSFVIWRRLAARAHCLRKFARPPSRRRREDAFEQRQRAEKEGAAMPAAIGRRPRPKIDQL